MYHGSALDLIREHRIEEFRDAFQVASVVGVTREGSGYRIETQSGSSLTAEHVVIATPIQVTQKLLHLPEINRPVRAHTFAICGRLRGPWTKGDIHLFSDSDSMLAISRQAGGRVLFCSRQETPDFGRFFSDYEILDHVYWNPAFHLDGDVLLECEQGENLYMIGDYNVCGLEDSYITGL